MVEAAGNCQCLEQKSKENDRCTAKTARFLQGIVQDTMNRFVWVRRQLNLVVIYANVKVPESCNLCEDHQWIVSSVVIFYVWVDY